MKLSIVIPVYNEEESISQTIDMLEQTFDCTNIDHEIFVVNDNSVDKTPDLLEQLSKKYASVRYETNNGLIEFLPGNTMPGSTSDLNSLGITICKFFHEIIKGHTQFQFIDS